MALAIQNSQIALEAKLGAQTTIKQRFKALQTTLNLKIVPNYLECFDISHTSGEATMASRVVFDSEGPKKTQYRHFSIEGIQPGDDYAAMRQALFRHYSRLKKEALPLPDILFIDGGKGQVAQAKAVLEELKITEVCCIGVAKGPGRKAGLETLILMNEDNQEINLDSHSPALHLIQHIRDESHRFAVLGHTHKRDKKRTESILERIEGVGAKRRQALYRHFGGLQEVKKASVDAMAKVPGISKELAEKIYEALH
jgi:excinuclease ABC subunit C